jgi:Kinesin motor domain.
MIKLINTGIQNRKTSGTAMNEDSSRSHLIVNITIDVYNKHTDQV